MSGPVSKWPFKSVPIAWGSQESGDSVFVYGIFEPKSRAQKRFKRVMVVARYFIANGEVRYEALGCAPTFGIKAFAKNHQAVYPASAKEHKKFLQMEMVPSKYEGGYRTYRSPNIGPQLGEA